MKRDEQNFCGQQGKASAPSRVKRLLISKESEVWTSGTMLKISLIQHLDAKHHSILTEVTTHISLVTCAVVLH